MIALAVHGGAGEVRAGAPGEQGMRRALTRCLEEGRALLTAGGSALDAVEASVRLLEDHPLFNAGRGAVLTSEGGAELDASIMDGTNRAAGAVANVTRLANPVSAARAVMEQSPHVLLVAGGAERFARERGLTFADPSSLVTEERRLQLERLHSRGATTLDHDGGGTVGAVALDATGHLAAATSTGGMVGKLPGRVSDSALPGAGTWADDATCAISATGHGEAFIRVSLSHEIDAGMRLADLDLETACQRALARVSALGSRGGLIALDASGQVVARFNTGALYRGWLDRDLTPEVRIFGDS